VKKIVPVLMTAGVMATFMGCAEESDPVSVNSPPPSIAAPAAPAGETAVVGQSTPESTPSEAPAGANAILVSLSVPNMV
jgi:hypothetical protein